MSEENVEENVKEAVVPGPEPIEEATPIEKPLENNTVVLNSTDGTVKIFYNGQEVVEKLGVFDADGAQECKLADGTTAFVPKAVLGE